MTFGTVTESSRHVIEEPIELALGVHVAVGEHRQLEVIAVQARPDAPAREVEGEREADDQADVGDPDEAAPGSS